MNSTQSSRQEEPLTARRRRIGLLVTAIALVIWAPFAVSEFTKAKAEFPVAPKAIQPAIRSHVESESLNTFDYPVCWFDPYFRQGRSK